MIRKVSLVGLVNGPSYPVRVSLVGHDILGINVPGMIQMVSYKGLAPKCVKANETQRKNSKTAKKPGWANIQVVWK
jgi:hypothetical protein